MRSKNEIKCVNTKCNSHSPGKFGDNCRYYKNIRDCEDLVELKTIQWLTVRWIDIKEMELPIGKMVLWKHESGHLSYAAIGGSTEFFLSGLGKNDASGKPWGKIIAWMPVPGEE